MTQSTWPPLEKSAQWMSMLITLLATILTALCVYLRQNPRPPMLVSLYFTAPIVIALGICALGYVAYSRSLLPDHVINGFAILGLCGGLLRLFPVSEF